MYWANFLHFYQPPNQTDEIVKKVTDESYRKVAKEILASPKGKITINISGSLTELLARNKFDDVLTDYKTLLEEGRVELMESAMYHPFMPRIPDSEIYRQIKLNREINSKVFGKSYKPAGFYIPEMVYTPKLGKLIRDEGYKWVIIDESGFPPELGSPRSDTLYKIKGLGDFYAFFRDRKSSFKILSAQIGTGKAFIDDFVTGHKKEDYLVTGMDGETFGHHRFGLEKLLGEVFLAEEVESVRISDLINIYKKVEEVTPLSSTWALFSMDEARKSPFSRWDDPENKIHRLQWELTDLALASVDKYGKEEDHLLLDKALHSDQYWWASAEPWWSIEMIERGANELNVAIANIKKAPEADKKRAKELYQEIVFLAFEWQRKGVVAERVRRHIDEEAHFRVKESLRGQSKEDLESLINHLKNQMDQAVKNGEYARAEEFKKRVKELEDNKQYLIKD